MRAIKEAGIGPNSKIILLSIIFILNTLFILSILFILNANTNDKQGGRIKLKAE